MTSPVSPSFLRRRRVLVGLLTAAVTAAVSVVPASTATSASVVAQTASGVPAFYDPPAELPAADGAMVRSEPLPLGLSLPGLDGPLPGRATRLMYKSTDSGGEPVAVTGAYIEPAADWKGDGPRPLVAVAPGHHGAGRPVRGLARPGASARR